VARFNYVRALTVDDIHGRLYIAPGYAGDRIRYIDFATGLIHTYAGGGTAPYPGYGDGGSATSANLKYPSGLAVTSEGNLFFRDDNTGAIRMVDYATGIISTVVPVLDPNCTSPSGKISSIAASSSGSSLAADSADNVYFSTIRCGVTGRQIMRRSPSGGIDAIAGGGTGLGTGILAA
jgi:hypothetical protein